MRMWMLLLGAAGSLAAQVSYTPQPLDFGAVKLGQTSPTMSTTLTNTGTDTLKFCGTLLPGCFGQSSMTGSAAFQYVTDNCTARPPGTTCTLQYRFAPKQIGPLSGANIVQTTHGPFPVNFVGVGQDTSTAPPPGPVVAGVQGSPVSVTLAAGSEFPISAVPADSFGQPLAVPVVWSSSVPTVATVRLPYTPVPQAAMLSAASVGTATITARAGGKSTTIGVTVTAPPPPPPPPPPVFGIRASWLTSLLPGCTITPGTPCTRGPLPVLADADGHVVAQITVTATFTAP